MGRNVLDGETPGVENERCGSVGLLMVSEPSKVAKEVSPSAGVKLRPVRYAVLSVLFKVVTSSADMERWLNAECNDKILGGSASSRSNSSISLQTER